MQSKKESPLQAGFLSLHNAIQEIVIMSVTHTIS